METSSSTMGHFLEVAPRDFTGIVDAVLRFGAGQDLRDRDLFESAFSAGAKLDFTQPSRKLGAHIPVFVGRESIAENIFANLKNLDTTHTITNARITSYDGSKARLFCLVEAQHLPKNDHSRHLLLKNFYFMDLSRSGSLWTVDAMRIENVWMHGEPSVLFPS